MAEHDYTANDLVTLVPLEGEYWRFRFSDFMLGLGIGALLLILAAIVALRLLH